MKMKNIILYIWQLPQNLLGLAVAFFSDALYLKTDDVYYTGYHFGVSLGKYIIINWNYDYTAIEHEEGHQKQSLYLGWLYLLLIGLPSAIGNILHRFIIFDYYAQPWEKWADELGGVKR